MFVDQRGKILAGHTVDHLRDELDPVHLARGRGTGIATAGHGQLAAQLSNLVGQSAAFIQQGTDAIGHIRGRGLELCRDAGQRGFLRAQPLEGFGAGQRLDPAYARAAGAVAQ